MITPYTELPIPRVETPFDPRFRGFLDDIRGFAIPGVIIDDSGADMTAARQAVVPVLREHLGANVEDDIDPITIRIGDHTAHPEDQHDRGLHMDAYPGAKQRFINLNLHRVACGAAQVRLTLASPGFMEALSRSHTEATAGTPMPAGTLALYAEGKVDTDVLSPEVYVGDLAARSMVIFNFTGRRPAAHDFVSRTAFRRSELITARFPI